MRLLKQTIAAWNAWRTEHLEIQPDLAGVFLTGLPFRGATLRGAHLMAAELRGCQIVVTRPGFISSRIDLSEEKDQLFSFLYSGQESQLYVWVAGIRQCIQWQRKHVLHPR